MTELRKITRADWVAALRSGEYSQEKGALRKDNGYCCLGVACVIAGVDLNKGLSTNAGHKKDLKTGSLDWIETRPVYDMLNLGQTIPYDGRILQETVVNMNDGRSSFGQIADYIEGLGNGSSGD